MKLEEIIAYLLKHHEVHIAKLKEFIRINYATIPIMISFGEPPRKVKGTDSGVWKEQTQLWNEAEMLIYGSAGHYARNGIKIRQGEYAYAHSAIPTLDRTLDLVDLYILPPLFTRAIIAFQDDGLIPWKIILGFFADIQKTGIDLSFPLIELLAKNEAITVFENFVLPFVYDYGMTPHPETVDTVENADEASVRNGFIMHKIYGCTDGVRHGHYQEHHRNGKISNISRYNKGLLEHTIEYDKHGNIMLRANFKEGKRHGLRIEYHPESTNFRSSVPDTDRVKTQFHYSHGELNGKQFTYAPNGQLLTEEEYKNGKLHNKQFYYHLDRNNKSKLHETIEYRDGVKFGELRKYYNSGAFKVKAYFYEGKLHGTLVKCNDPFRCVQHLVRDPSNEQYVKFERDYHHGKITSGKYLYFLDGNKIIDPKVPNLLS